MQRGVRDGLVDTIGSDHCGHHADVKPEDGLDGAMAGLPGLEAMVPIMVDAVLRGSDWLTRRGLVRHLTQRPAEVFGLGTKHGLEVGMDADIVAVDPDSSTSIEFTQLHDASAYSPYEGWHLKGRIRRVWRRGQLVVQDGAPMAAAGGHHLSAVA